MTPTVRNDSLSYFHLPCAATCGEWLPREEAAGRPHVRLQQAGEARVQRIRGRGAHFWSHPPADYRRGELLALSSWDMLAEVLV